MGDYEGRIKQSSIASVLQRANIVDDIGDLVNLHREGNHYIGVCPFDYADTPHPHGEHTLIVDPKENLYYCTSCGDSGSLTDFFQKKMRYTYDKVIDVLAEKYDIEVERHSAHEEPLTKKQRLKNIVQDAAKFYRTQLRTPQLDYLASREFAGEDLDNFWIGYAPKGNTLLHHLENLGYTHDDMLAAKVIKQNEDDGRYYDALRERITFGIPDSQGNLLSLVGRHCTEDGDTNTKGTKIAKYVNLENSIIFQKKKNIYGTWTRIFKDIVRQEQYAIIVEGPTDSITMQKHGLPGAAKLEGTLDKTQLSTLLKQRPDLEVYFMTDGDHPSLNTISQTDLRVAAELGVFPKVITLPPTGEDPADYFAFTEDAKAALKALPVDEGIIFYIKAQKMLATRDMEEEEAKSTLESFSFRMRLLEKTIDTYAQWTGSQGDILAYTEEAASFLQVPAESVFLKYAERAKPTLIKPHDQPIPQSIKEELLHTLLANILITDKQYSNTIAKEVPPTDSIFTPEQQELYQFIIDLKNTRNLNFAIERTMETGIKKARIGPAATTKQQGQLFETQDDLASIVQAGYDEGKLSHIPAAFLAKATDFFNEGITAPAAGIQKAIRARQQPALYNEMERVFREEQDYAKAAQINDQLYALIDKDTGE